MEKNEKPQFKECFVKANLTAVTNLNPSIKPNIQAPEKKDFVPLLNGIPTNGLISVSISNTPPVIDKITGKASIRKGSLNIYIDEYNKLTSGLRTSTSKLLDACAMKLTEQSNYRSNRNLKTLVQISLNEYAEMCGKPLTKASIKKLRQTVKEDLETLYRISLEWTEAKGGKVKDFAKMRITNSVGIVKGVINFNFTPEMAMYLVNSYIMQFPLEALKLDERNPNVYPLGRKLALHASIDNNKLRHTDDILSVEALLPVCPGIPTYERIMKEDKKVKQRIILPFIRALDSITFLESWEFCTAERIPVPKKQVEKMNYKSFTELYVHFKIRDIPDQSTRLEKRAEKVKTQKAKSR